MQITKQLRTETAHRLTNYSGRCAHLHGHSYLWEVTVRANALDDKNMVIDFKDLKKAMNHVLDPLDHALVLAPDDPLWEFDVNLEVPVLATVLHPTNNNNDKARLIKWEDNPTAESFAQWALDKIQARLCVACAPAPMPYFVYSVKVWETATSYAEAKSGEG